MKPVMGGDRPQLVVLKEITMNSPADPYLPLKALSAYSGLSVRWLRDRLREPHHPLPCYRLPAEKGGGKILVRRSEFDQWLTRYRALGDPDVTQVVEDVIAGLGVKNSLT
jgi:hypothetical protein